MEEKLYLINRGDRNYFLESRTNNIGNEKLRSVSAIGSLNPTLLEHKLSLKNCQEIENGYDLDELAKEKYPYEKTEMFSCFELDCKQEGFIEGAKTILEILGDKKFSDRDVILIAEYVRVASQSTPDTRTKDLFDEYQSLQQTEWEVEIVKVENTPIWENADVQGHVVCKKCGEWNESQIIPYKCKCVSKPKLDADGCLILKRI